MNGSIATRFPKRAVLRTALFVLVLGSTFLGIAVVVLVLTLQADADGLKRPLETSLRWLMGRDVEIGQLDQLQVSGDPQLSVAVRDLRVGNPDWADEPDFLRADMMSLRLDLRSLWSDGPMQIHGAELSGLSVTLLAPQDRTPNWHFWWSDDGGDLPDQIELP